MRNDSVTLRSHILRTDVRAEQPVVLVVGSDVGCQPDWAGRVTSFSETLVVGRRATGQAQECSLVLRDPTISSRHLSISRTSAGEFELSDLGSTNGTYVNGDRVKFPVRLQDGAVIFVGSHVLVFRTALLNHIEAIGHEAESPLGSVPTVSPTFAATCRRMRLLAATSEDVLLMGEMGVGKELYARAIHRASGRKGAFVTVDCVATPSEHLETELFGPSAGVLAPTATGKPGLIEQAERGTLFLDEIGELPAAIQARVLKFTEHQRLGVPWPTHSRDVDVRIIAATSRAAPSGDSSGLRPDLVAHFGADAISVPPLRDRVEDIGAFAHGLVAGQRKPFELAAFQALCLYTWPGNIRELCRTLASAAALAQGSDRIGFEHLPSSIFATPQIRSVTRRRRPRPSPTVQELEVLLRRHHGNVLRVSRELDRKPAVVYRWARRFGLAVKGLRA